MQDILPELFDEILEDLNKIQEHLEKKEFETIYRMGHGFKGACLNFNLTDLSDIFLSIEKNGKNKNARKIAEDIKRVKEYIANVKIEYI